MSTDPHIERPKDDQEGGDSLEDESREQQNTESSRRDLTPRFQELVDEMGERFRDALDRLS